MKTNKSYQKRIKVTRQGKLVTRKIGQNHFNARGSGNAVRRKHRTTSISMSNKDKSRYLN